MVAVAPLALSGAVEVTGILTVDTINEKTGAGGVITAHFTTNTVEAIFYPDTDPNQAWFFTAQYRVI